MCHKQSLQLGAVVKLNKKKKNLFSLGNSNYSVHTCMPHKNVSFHT